MPTVFHLILLVFALACFVLDTWQHPAPTKLTPLGLALLVASMISW